MSWLTLPRRPEPEVMDDSGEVEAYASAAAQAYLDAIDNTLVDQAVALAPDRGRMLDIGTGPGSIPLKIARHCAGMCVVGIDRSRNMIVNARRAAKEQDLAERAFFFLGDATHLAFPDASFDIVLSNSLLHHLARPAPALNEMARVARPEGMILLRDLRRPSRLVFPFHVRWYGRYYSGLMYQLYVNSVRAAYTMEELADLLCQCRLADAQVFRHGHTHLGFIHSGRERRRNSPHEDAVVK